MAFAELRRDSTATTDRSDTLSPLTAQKQEIIVSIRYFDRLGAKLLLTNQIHRFSCDIRGHQKQFVMSRSVLARVGRAVRRSGAANQHPAKLSNPETLKKMPGAKVKAFGSYAQKCARLFQPSGSRPSLIMTPGFQDPVRPFSSIFRGRRVRGFKSVDLLREPSFRQTSSFLPGPLSVELSNNDRILVGPVRVEAARELLSRQLCIPIPPRALKR